MSDFTPSPDIARVNAQLARDRADLQAQQDARHAEQQASETLTLEVLGFNISGWQSVRITRGIERCPSDFDIALTEKYPGAVQAQPVFAGVTCRVRIGSDLVVSGYVDRYSESISPNTHSVTISGRSACADIVDCSVQWRNMVINQTDLVDTAEKLCEPYGVKVRPLAGRGPIIQQLTLNLGETPFQVIERVARYAGMLIYDDVEGNLVLAGVGKDRMSSGVEQAKNVLEANGQAFLDKRYNEYHAFISSVDSLTDSTRQDSYGGNLRASVVDDGMQKLERLDGQPRKRVLSIISEQPDQQEYFCERRARWEMLRRYGRSQTVRAVVDSWRDSAGRLWEPNCLVPVKLPAVKLGAASWLISEVSYVRDDRGTRAELTLMPPQAFEPEPTILMPSVHLDFLPDGRRDKN